MNRLITVSLAAALIIASASLTKAQETPAPTAEKKESSSAAEGKKQSAETSQKDNIVS